MTTLKLTAYAGKDPEDGTGTYMVTLTDPAYPEQVDCFAMAADENSDVAIRDVEGVQIALSVGIWRFGKAQPIAHQFLAQPGLETLWQIDVEGARKQ